MPAKLTTDFRVLMQLASALGQAKKSGDAEAIATAQREHDAYHAQCQAADEMALGYTLRDLA